MLLSHETSFGPELPIRLSTGNRKGMCLVESSDLRWVSIGALGGDIWRGVTWAQPQLMLMQQERCGAPRHICPIKYNTRVAARIAAIPSVR